METIQAFFGGCCPGCDTQHSEPEILPVQDVFHPVKSKSRTELAEDVIDPSINLHGWTVREGHRLVMVEIDKEGGALGMALEEARDGVMVSSIEDGGLVAQWNQDHPLRAVKPGDVIFEVNKKQGKYKELRDKLKKEERVTMILRSD
ncbi:unnamed protein product [Effrenium voratum]|uniref:PDZ domain-containing protein n=1 Tax=Effrenium voratum TaxID=2562239 RepID=A0AA36I601_9DINO|nr:unnamed protein product [Effrenium voratum]CAJ1427405.1 unnamed protein product [Effrenium voratum]